MSLLRLLVDAPAQLSLRLHLSLFWSGIVVLVGPFVMVLGTFLLIVLLVRLTVRASRARPTSLISIFAAKELPKLAYLELILPIGAGKSSYSTERLYSLLHPQIDEPGIFSQLGLRKYHYSLEISATRNKGIRYFLCVPTPEKDMMIHNLSAYLPGIDVRETSDYLTMRTAKYQRITSLAFANHFAWPLDSGHALAEHDPIAFLASQMTKLTPTELTAFQLVIAPITSRNHPVLSQQIKRLRRAIDTGQPILSLITQTSFATKVVNLTTAPIKVIIKAVAWFILFTLTPGRATWPALRARNNLDSTLNVREQAARAAVGSKLAMPLFEASIRLLVAGDDAARVNDRAVRLNAIFRNFGGPNQRLVPMTPRFRNARQRLIQHFNLRQLSRRFAASAVVLSSTELSDLYHIPHTENSTVEGLQLVRSVNLAAPVSTKRETNLEDVIIGQNIQTGETTPITLTREERLMHTYIIGKTGMGKSTMLTQMIKSDMERGAGLIVLDPHGDLYQDLAGLVPTTRVNDVVLLDPSDRDFPVGLNILSPGIHFADPADSAEWITSSVLSIFAKLTEERYWGPRMEHILRNATLTALTTNQPTLYTLQRLLTDRPYHRSVARGLADPILKQFWDKEVAMLGSMQWAGAVAPLTHRLGQFMTQPMARNILMQPTTSVRIADIMNQGKILLVNLSKGALGEDLSQFFGTMLTSLITTAAYQRSQLLEPKRCDFFVYVDEFQNFATPRFAELSAEGRKFHLGLTLSHQSTAQLSDRQTVQIIASNASTLVSFKTGPDDERFILPYMQPEVKEGHITNLAPHHFYIKTTTAASEGAFSGATITTGVIPSPAIRNAVRQASRKRYGKPRSSVEVTIASLLATPASRGETTKPPSKSRAPRAKKALQKS